MSRVLYLVGTAAPPVRQIEDACDLAIADGWNPYVVLTPTASTWVDLDKVQRVSRNQVRVYPRLPGEEDPLPLADAVLAAPLTFNAINKWANGISDNLALSLLNELLGTGVPITAVPCAKPALQTHPAFQPNLELLRDAGVHMSLVDTLAYRGDDQLMQFEWTAIFQKLRQAPQVDDGSS